MRKIALMIALFVGIAAIAGASRTSARSQSLLRGTGCSAGSVRLAASDRVVLTKYGCRKNSRRIPTAVTYDYSQLDYGRGVCGSSSGRGASFAPKIAGSFYLRVNFTVRPAHPTRRVRPVSTGVREMTLRHWQVQCATYPATFPSRSEICDVNPNKQRPDGTYECNFDVLDPAYANIPLPRFAGMPLLIGHAIYSPRLFIPQSGRCTEHPYGNAMVMGGEGDFAWWDCPNHMLVETQLTVYYFPPGSESVCTAPDLFDPTPLAYTVGPLSTVPNESFLRVQLPADFIMWGGDAEVAFHENVYPNSGLIKASVAEQWANIDVRFIGSENACAEMIPFHLVH